MGNPDLHNQFLLQGAKSLLTEAFASGLIVVVSFFSEHTVLQITTLQLSGDINGGLTSQTCCYKNTPDSVPQLSPPQRIPQKEIEPKNHSSVKNG